MSLIIAMFIFAFTMSITPGPNNLISLSNGVNYGFKASIPFVCGVVVGFTFLSLFSGIGLSQIVADNDIFMKILSYVGTGFIVYLSYKIATAKLNLKNDNRIKPGFYHGVLFQWVNPKAWIGSLAGISAFNLVNDLNALFLFLAIYAIVIFIAVSIWAYTGSKIAHFLENEQNHKIFNICMGLSLFSVAVYLFFMQFNNQIF